MRCAVYGKLSHYPARNSGCPLTHRLKRSLSIRLLIFVPFATLSLKYAEYVEDLSADEISNKIKFFPIKMTIICLALGSKGFS
jgi:hypothetical protein